MECNTYKRIKEKHMKDEDEYKADMPLWYKEAVIYELHVKGFYDSNADGIGDFRGLISRLDYLKNLGVTVIWLLPFYPSPFKDDGYDIANHFNVHPAFGTLQDFKEFLKQAHKLKMRVITEMVLNHTSDEHSWFQKSRRAKPGSLWRNFFVWSDTPEKYNDARIIFKDFETSNWSWDPVAESYYWHRFYSHQPDLNYDSRKVQKVIFDVIDFWLGMGVDGLRLDAVPYLYEREGTNCENLPETHAFLKKLRAHVEKKFQDRMLLAEANQWPEDAAVYFGNGDECHMAFNFPLMPRMFMALEMEDRFPITDILDSLIAIPESCQWALFLRNHDELTLEMVTDEERDYMYRVYAQDPHTKINMGIRRRLAPLLSNDRRKIEVMNALLFTLNGTPVIYYGDEIGMGDNYYLGDRNGVRTPIQWSPDRNAGFSQANPQKLYLPVIIDPEYHYEVVNIENQDRNFSSLLWWMRRIITARKRFKAFSYGDITFLNPMNRKIIAYIRTFGDEIILVVVNLSKFSQVVELDLSKYEGFIPEEIFSQNRFPIITANPFIITMGPYNYFWFSLHKDQESIFIEPKEALPLILLNKEFKDLLEGEAKELLEQDALLKYLKHSRWFGGKGRSVRGINIIEATPIVRKNIPPIYFIIVKVIYEDVASENYFIPLSFASQEKIQLFKQLFPQGIIANIIVDGKEGILYDALYNKDLHHIFLDMIAKRKRVKGRLGEFVASPHRKFKSYIMGTDVPFDSTVLEIEQSNTSIVYNNIFILKFIRRIESGVHPDAEIIRALTEKAHFPHIAPFAGLIEYQRQHQNITLVGLLQKFVPNEGDAWSFTLDNVQKYCERILAQKPSIEEIPQIDFFRTDKELSTTNNFLDEYVGAFFSEMVCLLGQRTGQMHNSLFSLTEDPSFAPESFSILYQRSVFQSMRSLVRNVFNLLKNNISRFPHNLKKDASEVLSLEKRILNRLAKIVGKKVSAMKIRIHGDYHLGQVLFTGKDFVIIDFEGEPAHAISQRRLKHSALRDVAAMIRSFHYAAYSGFLRYPYVHQDDRGFLEEWIKVWYQYICNLFIRSYLNTVNDTPLLPQNMEDFHILFNAFILEKAVYELGYELNNRPDWVTIPIKGIQHIIL